MTLRGLAGVVCAVGLAALAAAPAGAAAPPSAADLTLRAGAPTTLRFAPDARSSPTPQRPADVHATPRAPFVLTAAVPAGGAWELTVTLPSAPSDAGTGRRVAGDSLRFRVEPLGRHRPRGCRATAWRPVGGGARVAVIQGPGVCRLRVRLAWRWPADLPPGRYTGVLRWSLSSAPP